MPYLYYLWYTMASVQSIFIIAELLGPDVWIYYERREGLYLCFVNVWFFLGHSFSLNHFQKQALGEVEIRALQTEEEKQMQIANFGILRLQCNVRLDVLVCSCLRNVFLVGCRNAEKCNQRNINNGDISHDMWQKGYRTLPLQAFLLCHLQLEEVQCFTKENMNNLNISCHQW